MFLEFNEDVTETSCSDKARDRRVYRKTLILNRTVS